MLGTQDNEIGSPSAAVHWFREYWHIAVLAVCYYLTNQNVAASNYNVNLPIDFLADTAGSGSTTRQIAFVILALYGITGLRLVWATRPQLSKNLGVAIVLLISWMLLSVLWSPNLHDSLARSFGVVAVILAALRLRTSVKQSTFIAGLTLVTVLYALFGLGCEVTLGTFVPWQSEYRFAGTLHPNEQGINCSLWAAGAYWMWRLHGRRRIWLVLCMVGVVFALATKSRTSTLSMLFAVLAFLFFTQQRRITSMLTCSVLAMVLACTAWLQVNQVETLGSSLKFGRDTSTSDDATLTGRLPLWGELMESVDQNPIAGIGFGGFWTSANIEKYSKDQGWGISAAHSTYMDLLLSVGIVGLCLYAGTVLIAIVKAISRSQRSSVIGPSYFGTLLCFVLVDGFTDSEPVIVSSLLCLCFFLSLFQLGLFTSADAELIDAPIPAPSRGELPPKTVYQHPISA